MRVLLIDPRLLTRAAIRCLLASRPGFRVVGEAGTIQEAVAITGALRPDVVLLGVGPPSPAGVAGVPVLSGTTGVPLPVVSLLDATENQGHDAARLWAGSCVSTAQPAEALFSALERACRRDASAVPSQDDGRRVTTPPDGPHSRIEALTRREREVVSLVCEGLRNKQIADRLSVTDVTVRHHLTSVFSKLGVTDRLGLLIFATRCGLAGASSQLDSSS